MFADIAQTMTITEICNSHYLPEIAQPPQEPLNTLTQRRLKKLIRGSVGHAFEPTLILQAALGLRPSENYYLHWRHID